MANSFSGKVAEPIEIPFLISKRETFIEELPKSIPNEYLIFYLIKFLTFHNRLKKNV